MANSYLNLIHVSRAVVPLLVMLSHASISALAYLDYNFLGITELPRTGGVDFFFVLSGFMIFYLHQKDINNREAIKPFLINRTIRLYPLFWIFSLVVMALYFAVPSMGEAYHRDGGYIISSFLLFPHEYPPFVGGTWSLIHTMFFYIIFATLLYWGRKSILPVLVLWVVGTVIFHLSPSTFPIISMAFNPMNIEFLIGCFCAYLVTNKELKKGFTIASLGVALYLFTWAGTILFDLNFNYVLMYALASGLLILGLAAVDKKKNIHIHPLLKYLGNASFSIYLTNILSLTVIYKTFEILSLNNYINNHVLFIASLLVTVIVGCAVHNYIEKPLIKILKKRLIRKKPTALVADGLIK